MNADLWRAWCELLNGEAPMRERGVVGVDESEDRAGPVLAFPVRQSP